MRAHGLLLLLLAVICAGEADKQAVAPSPSETCIDAKETRWSKSEQVTHALGCLSAPGGSAWWGVSWPLVAARSY